MTTELTNLMWVAAFTAMLWMPYILNRLAVGPGLLHEIGYPDTPTKLSPWADRLKRAHYNAVENLVVFAPLVLIAHVVGIHSSFTALASTVFLVARIVHALVYTFAIPWLRTISFTVGWLCQLAFVYAILTH